MNPEYLQQQEIEKQKERDQQKVEQEQAEAKRIADLDGRDPIEKDPKKYGLVDNLKEGGNAVVGGVVDIYNSVGSIPKFFDPKFYKPADPENPYEYKAPWLIKNKPITNTRWGSFVRTGIEFAGGMIGTGKVLWGVKGLKGLATAAKSTRWGRVGLSGVQGAGYDLISNQSQESNLAAQIVDMYPNTAGIFDPLATKEHMSPFKKALYNTGEGLQLGGLLDIAVEAGGWGMRSWSKSAKKAAKKQAIVSDPIMDAVEKSADINYAAKQQVVYDGTVAKYKTENPSKSFKSLDKAQQKELMTRFAEESNIDWGDYRDMTLRGVSQGKNLKDLAVEQLEFDLATGTPRENPAYYKGGDVTDNAALSTSDNPVEAVRDMMTIRNNPTQKYGAPRGTLTEANIRRMNYAAPGFTVSQIDELAAAYKADPAYEALKGKATFDDMVENARHIDEFLEQSGHGHLYEVPEEDLVRYVQDLSKGNESKIEGLPILNKEQLDAADAMLGQLSSEQRDLAKAGLSVMDGIDITADGGLLDMIMARKTAIGKLRKETSVASSWNLRRFGVMEKDKVMKMAAESVQNENDTFKQLLKNDVDDDLLETFMHFSANSGTNQQTMKDFDAFFKRKLKGYKGADGYQRNAILNEAMTMGVNSMLSGPKTPVRALIGTGLGTVMRPVATVLGSLGRNDRITKGAFSSMGAMLDARNDAWKKAVKDFNSYATHEEGWRGFTQTKKDNEWNAMMSYFDQFGTQGEKAQAHFANAMREVNKSPFLNYGPRVMKSMDVFFSQIIGRGRLRQLAYDDVYDGLAATGKVVSDKDMDELVRNAEKAFEGKVFSADGQITDEMAKFAGDEAKLTQELSGFAKDLDKAFDQMPFLRPFFLFARTGVNALKMTSKYTPIMNNFIGEHVDIMTKQWDNPDLLKYGIKSANDLELAQSVMRGRMATGYMFTSTAAWMALNGNVTGNGPPDRQLRNSWIQSGKWQPRSFKIGDTYISYEAIEPFNMFFSFIADTVDAQKVMGDQWTSNQFGKLSYLISANITNKSFLAGLLQMQDLLTSQGGDAQRVLANFANNQVPLSGLRNEIGKLVSPGMRELETGFWQSIGNRNLYADLITRDGFMPYKYDILNGEKIRAWDPMTRLVNGILPFNINVGTNETRELLMRSGVNLVTAFNTGPDGQRLEGHPDLKSKYQFYMGQQGLEGELAELFKNPDIRQSINDMERNRERGSIYDTDGTLHGPLIEAKFRAAKQAAWAQMDADPNLGEKLRRLEKIHDLQMLGEKAMQAGDRKRARNIEKQVKKLQDMQYR